MRPDSIATRQTWRAPADQRRSAVAYAPLRPNRIIVLDKPLAEAEWDMVRDFVRRMERDDLRRRFGHPCDFSDEATLRRYFDIDAGVGEIACVLDQMGAIAGLAHRIMVSRSEVEIGLIVRSDLKRAGIGELLLREMLARSARQGLKTLSGLVLRENRAMLRLAAKIGYVPREVCAWTVELMFEVGQAAAT